MRPLLPSELIINPDGSIYHLNVKPEDICENIILVGDPERVPKVSKHFTTLDKIITKREFVIHIGTLNQKKIMVLSTGMGTDNIEIVMNELDALANIDFSTRTLKPEFTTLNFIRIGTSGSIRQNIPLGSFLISDWGIGLDGMLNFYESQSVRNREYEKAVTNQLQLNDLGISPYVTNVSTVLRNQFSSDDFIQGNTLTLNGFYAPQGRSLRAKLALPNWLELLQQFNYQNNIITNLEMETAGMYGLANILGHRAISFNCILANRTLGTFAKKPKELVEEMIVKVLELI